MTKMKKKTTTNKRKKTTTKKRKPLPFFVNQLSDKQEKYVRGALTRNLRNEGYKGKALKEFVQIGMDSKVRDLPEFIVKKLKNK